MVPADRVQGGSLAVGQDSDLVQHIVEALDIEGGSTQRRPVHTIGVGATGVFEPSSVAREFCTAPHFISPRTRVTMRFSNGIGLVQPHDGWSDVRGMAVRFHLPEGATTDLIAMTLPVFFAPTPETFLHFARAARPATLGCAVGGHRRRRGHRGGRRPLCRQSQSERSRDESGHGDGPADRAGTRCSAPADPGSGHGSADQGGCEQ